MAKVTEGMKVCIKARQASQEEIKNGRYFPHLGGLSGEVQRVYSNTEVAVKIEPESLPADIQQRHRQQEDAMRNRWLESLSDEARNRLTPDEKAFHLNYVVLVAANDLEPFKGTKGRGDAGTRERGETRGQGDKETGRPLTTSQPAKPSASGRAIPATPTAPAPSKGGKEAPKAPVREKPSPASTSTAAPKVSPKAGKTATTEPAATKQAQSTRATKPSATPVAAARSSRQEVKTTTPTLKQPTLFEEPPPKRRTMKELEKAEEQYLKAKKKGRSS